MIVACLLLAALFGAPVHDLFAQLPTLEPFVTVNGSIAGPDDREDWQFFALEGTLISLWVQPDGGSFDPQLALLNSAGSVLMTNDDYAYPATTDAAFQAITLPRTDTYRVSVSAFGSSTGNYALTLFYGYANLALANPFRGTANWETEGSAAVSEAEGIVELSASGNAISGYAYDDISESYEDFYVRIAVDVSGRGGWNTGLVLRDDGERRYVLIIGSRGQWRLLAFDGTAARTVRDWTSHPAIRPGETRFTLAVLVNGSAFDVFYNDAFVGQAIDRGTPRSASGRVGLFVETPAAPGSDTTAQFSDLYVTLPRQINGFDVLPQQLMSGSLGLTIQELERRRVIPAGGQQTLSVPESSGQQVAPGVNRVLLGRGVTFNQMVLSTTFTLQTQRGALVGCGLVFGSQTDTQYTVSYLDSTGAYGLAPRTGDTFTAGIYGESGRQQWTEGRQHLLIVRLASQIHYYVNRVHVGSLTLPAVTGEVGNAVVNYENVTTICSFSDTWLWALE
jgi:hypothetical protein